MCKPVKIIALCLALFVIPGCSATRPSAAPSDRANQLTPESSRPPVHLNYIYLALDAQTVDAINESQFVRDNFCLFGQSTAAAGRPKTWSATYLLGQTTCLELFAPPTSQGGAEGNAGVCFSTANTGDIDIIYDKLRTSLGPNIKRGSTTFNTGAAQVPWFRYVSSHLTQQTPPLLTWVTEHDPSFHKAIGYKSSRRAALLSGIELPARPQKPHPQRLFRDITGVTLSLTQAEFEQLAAELSAYGYVRKKAGGLTVFSGPAIEIRAAVSEDPEYRIRSLSCSLTRRPDAPAQLNFGDKATLTLTEDATAIWTFGPKQNQFARN